MKTIMTLVLMKIGINMVSMIKMTDMHMERQATVTMITMVMGLVKEKDKIWIGKNISQWKLEELFLIISGML
jgi:hypothetical protein